MEEQRLSGRGEVRVVADAAELTRVAAEEVVAALARRGGAAALAPGAADRSSLPRVPSWALAGGSTPRALYRLLADPAAPFRGRIDWAALHFFWGDERHVPPDHPDSNFRMAREAMLDHVPAPAEHVHRVHAEEPDAARAAERYERELIEVFGLRPDGGGHDEPVAGDDAMHATRGIWPRFDLVLLGLGEEGHTASLFPGSPLLAEPGRKALAERRQRLAAAVWVEAQKTWRITLTPSVLNRAAKVIFLVSGAAKAPALAEVLEGEPRPELYPAQVIAPVDGKLLWLVDRAAAARLRSI